MTVRYIPDCEEPRRAVLTALSEEHKLAAQTALNAILSLRLLALSLPTAILAFAEMAINNPDLKSLVLLFSASLLVTIALGVT